jgi:hypothetical protein
MDIAYYMVGNIKDPLGKVHNRNGDPILKKREVIITDLKCVRAQVYKPPGNTWLPLFGRVMVYDAGDGRLVRTDKRFIFLRRPYIRGIILNKEIPEEKALDISFKAKSWEREKKLECVVISMREVKNIKRRPGVGITLKVEDKRGRFLVNFGSPLVVDI